MSRSSPGSVVVGLVAGVLSIIVYVLAVLVGMSLSSCVQAHEAELPPQTDQALEVAMAGDDAWRAAGLRSVDSTICRLDELRIVVSADCHEQGCLGWQRQGEVPIAYIRPELADKPLIVEHLALHEWMHAAGYCYGRWRRHINALGQWDPFDTLHEDPAVWDGFDYSSPYNVEQRAQRALDEAHQRAPPQGGGS